MLILGLYLKSFCAFAIFNRPLVGKLISGLLYWKTFDQHESVFWGKKHFLDTKLYYMW